MMGRKEFDLFGYKIDFVKKSDLPIFAEEEKILKTDFYKEICDIHNLAEQAGALAVFFFYKKIPEKQDFLLRKSIAIFTQEYLEITQNSEYFNKFISGKDWSVAIHRKPDILRAKFMQSTKDLDQSKVKVLNVYNEWTDDDYMKDLFEMKMPLNNFEKFIVQRQYLQSMWSLYQKNPVLKEFDMKENVRYAEKLLRDYDDESEFSRQQIETHDFAIRIPTKDELKGMIPASFVTRIFRKFQIIFDSLDEGMNSVSVPTYFVGLGAKSAIVYADLGSDVPENIKEEYIDRLHRSISSFDLLKAENDTETEIKSKASEFIHKINTDSVNASRIADAINEIIPSPADEISSLEIHIPRKAYIQTLIPEDRTRVSKVRSYLSKNKKNKDDDTQIVRGELGEVSMFKNDKYHRFKIKPVEGTSPYIYFPRDSGMLEEIKNKLQNLAAVRVKYLKGKWYFVEWVT